MKRISLLIVVIVLAISGWFAWWAWGRSPAEQVEARQRAFLQAVEERDWSTVKAMLTQDYADDYGHDRDSAVEDARRALGGFLALTVKPEVVTLQAVPDLAMVKVNIRVEGRGLGLSEMVLSLVNGMTEPWFFHWHKKGRWPWDWKIVQIHHNELRLPQ